MVEDVFEGRSVEVGALLVSEVGLAVGAVLGVAGEIFFVSALAVGLPASSED